MNFQLAFWLILSALFLGFCIGRFIFFMKNGQLITNVVKQRSVYARNFKPGVIYKAMASQLKKDGFVVVADVRDLTKLKKEIAKAANLSVEALEAEDRGRGNFKISKKEDEKTSKL